MGVFYALGLSIGRGFAWYHGSRGILELPDPRSIAQSQVRPLVWVPLSSLTVFSFFETLTVSCSDSSAVTLTQFVLTEQRKHPEATGDLSIILAAVQTACKTISSAVRRVGLLALHGAHGSTNATGDDVKKLDVISNEVFVNNLIATGRVAVMATEEADEMIVMDKLTGAKYGLVFDPLDGSSNIDCNVSVGSIFGIYRRPGAADHVPTPADVMQPGRQLVAAGYCMYGSSTEMVLTFGGGSGVHVFSLDPSVGEFMLTRRGLKIPEKPQRVSITAHVEAQVSCCNPAFYLALCWFNSRRSTLVTRVTTLLSQRDSSASWTMQRRGRSPIPSDT
jgi:Fructose-1-6-bisphosphatase, N-terminal domain